MNNGSSIDDGTWKIILEAKSKLVEFLPRVVRLPRETVEDCVSEAMIEFVVAYDPVEIATEANHIYVEREAIIFGRIKKAAERRISKERRMSSKSVSDDTPLGEEDGDFRLRDLFVPRANTSERVENYAEWKMFSRRGGCPLSPEEIEDLFGFSIPVEL